MKGILLFLIAAFWTVFIWSAATHNAQYDQEADEYANRYEPYAQAEIEQACAGLDGDSLTNCVAGYVAAQRDSYRREQDLAAQRKMADWSLGVLGASVITMAVTAGGVVLVYFTLVEARKTTRAAIKGTDAAERSVEQARKSTKFAQQTAEASREALLATDRAWLSVVVELKAPLIFEDEKISVLARIVVRNVGNSPATHIGMISELCANIVEGGYRAEELSKPEAHAIYRALHSGRTLFPGKWVAENAILELPTEKFVTAITEYVEATKDDPRPPARSAFPAILAGARYILPGDSRFRFSLIPFEIRPADNMHEGWDGSNCTVWQEELVLEQGFMTGRIT